MLFDSSIRKELARSFGATLIILVTVIMTMTLIRTLGMASRGSFNPSDVMLVMGYTMLSFLPNIMTVAMFVSTIMSLSRLYSDSEMVIWFTSGMGLRNLLRPLLRFAWPILLAIASLSLFALPWANRQVETLRAQYENRGDLERVQPGQFQEAGGGNRVFFVEKDPGDELQVHNVFVSTNEKGKETITAARNGHTELVDGDHFLVLERGQRFESTLGKRDVKIAEFERYHTLVAQDTFAPSNDIPLSNIPMMRLISEPTPNHLGEISMRMGWFMAALNLSILALAVTRVNPRVGRSGNLVFGLLMFQVYFNLLTLGQAWIASEKIGFWMFNVLLHGGMLLLGVFWLSMRQHNWGWRFHPSVWLPRRRSCAPTTPPSP